MARLRIVSLLLGMGIGVGCGGSQEAESTERVQLPASTGDEEGLAQDEVVREDEVQSPAQGGGVIGVLRTGRGGGGTHEGTIGLGDLETISGQGTAQPSEQERAAMAARRQTRLAAEEAEYQARCGAVTLTPGLPPSPPPAPSTPGLDVLRPIHRTSLAAPMTPPPNNSMAAVNEWTRTTFAPWVQDATTQLRQLEQAAGAAPEADHQHARVWIAHAHAVFIERFQSAPIPDEIARDPELRSVYLSAFSDQSEPLLRRVTLLVDGVILPGPWAGWKAAMHAWLAQEACALH